jgi:hypothetical protein
MATWAIQMVHPLRGRLIRTCCRQIQIRSRMEHRSPNPFRILDKSYPCSQSNEFGVLILNKPTLLHEVGELSESLLSF